MSFPRKSWYPARPAPTLNLTPLLDVLLILVVTMLVQMTQLTKHVPVELPVSDIAGVPVITQSVEISIAPSGGLIYQLSPISMEQLARRVNSEVTIELAVDRSVTYDIVMARVSELQRLQPKTIALVTR